MRFSFLVISTGAKRSGEISVLPKLFLSMEKAALLGKDEMSPLRRKPAYGRHDGGGAEVRFKADSPSPKKGYSFTLNALAGFFPAHGA